MNSIRSLINQQTQQIQASSALRKAASSPQPPQLTSDENSLINQEFTASKPLQSYSVNGRMNEHQIVRGAKFDARV
jgi:hypothetical protein